MSTVSRISSRLTLTLLAAIALSHSLAGNEGYDPSAPYLVIEDREDTDYSAFSLEELFNLSVVTASKQEESQWEAPGVVTVITARDMAIFGARNLYDALERVPGLTNFYSVHIKRNSIRGGESDFAFQHILMLIDGRPLRASNGNYGMYSAYFTFPVGLIDRVEVVRGPGSVLYGTNAFEGVINIITKKGSENPSQVSVTAGSFQTKGGQVFLALEKNSFNLQLGVHYYDTEGWSSEFLARNLFTGELTSANEKVWEDDLGIRLSATYKDLSLSLFSGKHKKWEEFFFDPAYDISIHSDVSLYDLGYKHSFDDNWRMEVNITNNQEDYRNPVTDTTSPDRDAFIGIQSLSDDLLIEATAYRKLGSKGTFLFGGVYQSLTGENVETPFAPFFDYDTDSVSAYASFDFQINRFMKIIAGVQYNKSKKRKSDVVPRVGAVFHLSPRLGMKVLWGEAYRSPGAFELEIDTIVQQGNPDLTPEKIATFDVQLFSKQDNSEFALTYYNSKESNLIRSVPSAEHSIGEVMNVGELRLSGFEFEAKLIPQPNWYIIGSVATQANKDDKGIDNTTLMPNTVTKIGVAYSQAWGSLALFDTYYKKFFPNNFVTSESPVFLNPNPEAFHMVNANFVFSFDDLFSSSNDLIIELFSNNLLDEEVWVPESFLNLVNTVPGSSGRAFYGTLKLRF